jgi:hypothetical protein
MTTLANKMKNAHKLAKTFEGDYVACLALALIELSKNNGELTFSQKLDLDIDSLISEEDNEKINAKMIIENTAKKTYKKTPRNSYQSSSVSYSYLISGEGKELIVTLKTTGFASKVKETVLQSGWVSEKQLDILFA